MNIRIVFIALVMIISPIFFLYFYSSYYAKKFHAKERAFHGEMLNMLNGQKEKSFLVSELFDVKSGEFICLVSGWDNHGKVAGLGDYAALERGGLTRADIREHRDFFYEWLFLKPSDHYLILLTPKKKTRLVQILDFSYFYDWENPSKNSQEIGYGCYGDSKEIAIKSSNRIAVEPYFFVF